MVDAHELGRGVYTHYGRHRLSCWLGGNHRASCADHILIGAVFVLSESVHVHVSGGGGHSSQCAQLVACHAVCYRAHELSHS